MNRLNTGDTGQAVTSSNDGLLYSGFIGDGMYVLSSGSEFEVEVQSNNLLRMADGSALMQGRHIEIPASDSEYITINNGSQGMNRKDLVVFRYTKNVTGVESVNVVVIEGEETSGTPQAPDYIEGDILTGATLADMPLYVVELQGINITSVTPQFETIGSHKNVVDKIAEHTAAIANLNSNLTPSTHTPMSDYITFNSNVTVNQLVGIKVAPHLLLVHYDIQASLSAGENVIGSATSNVKYVTYGAGRISTSNGTFNASIVVIPGGAVRIHGGNAGNGSASAGTVLLVI